jgi:hypothetical protein
MKIKLAIALATLLASGVVAQAYLTPYQGTHRAAELNPVTQDSGSASARLKRNYFQASPSAKHEKIGRCTVSTFVFTKIRLARACY